jgi:phage shock protein E
MGRFAEASNQGARSARELVAHGAMLLDVRTAEEFRAGHLDGALNVPVQQLMQRIAELGDRSRTIVVYCRSGNRSALAAELLRTQGYQHVYDLGAMLNWSQS